jgi:hypothetical protein
LPSSNIMITSDQRPNEFGGRIPGDSLAERSPFYAGEGMSVFRTDPDAETIPSMAGGQTWLKSRFRSGPVRLESGSKLQIGFLGNINLIRAPVVWPLELRCCMAMLQLERAV